MKRDRIWNWLLTIALVILFFGSVTLVSAEEPLMIVGVLEVSKRKIYLITDKDKYMVVGQDFSRLIGHKVKATGKVIESYRGKSFVVSGLEIVRD